ncbi:MAG: hypothetical protein EA401_02040, partial [Planctomycetota bacterium]
ATRRIGLGHWQDRIPAVGSGEVRHLRQDLESMRSALVALDQRHRQAERLATLGMFTATIAHEVRNPLSAIRLTIQMLRQQHSNDTSLPMIENEIERLDDIVDELLGFSRGMTVEVQACNLTTVASDVRRLLHRQLEHSEIELSIEGTTQVQADPRRMRQMLLNLVLNAIHALHSKEDGERLITIALFADGCAVYDNGPGVPDAVRETLFDAFSTQRAEGTGLGLHLARLIAEAHQCSLQYETSPMGGAGFVVRGFPSPPSRASRGQ